MRGGDRVPQVLRIDFVQAARGQISGRLQPYRDPACGCILSTTFEGKLEGNQIAGTFVTVSLRRRRASDWQLGGHAQGVAGKSGSARHEGRTGSHRYR